MGGTFRRHLRGERLLRARVRSAAHRVRYGHIPRTPASNTIRARAAMRAVERINMPEIYKEFEIIYCDQGSDEIKVQEVTSLMTEKEAGRIAAAWQGASWTEGRKFSYRERDLT